MSDPIDRQAAIDTFEKELSAKYNRRELAIGFVGIKSILENLPSAQPTLDGYNIEHLVLIAKLLEKENLPPERVSDALTDIGRVVAIAEKEFEEMLRKAVKQCMT